MGRKKTRMLHTQILRNRRRGKAFRALKAAQRERLGDCKEKNSNSTPDRDTKNNIPLISNSTSSVNTGLKQCKSPKSDKQRQTQILPSKRLSRTAARAACEKIHLAYQKGTISNISGPFFNDEESETLPNETLPNSAKTKKNYNLLPYEPGSLSVELECEEEYLSSVQAQYFLKNANEFNEVMKYLHDLNSRGARIIYKEEGVNLVYEPYTRSSISVNPEISIDMVITPHMKKKVILKKERML